MFTSASSRYHDQACCHLSIPPALLTFQLAPLPLPPLPLPSSIHLSSGSTPKARISFLIFFLKYHYSHSGYLVYGKRPHLHVSCLTPGINSFLPPPLTLGGASRMPRLLVTYISPSSFVNFFWNLLLTCGPVMGLWYASRKCGPDWERGKLIALSQQLCREKLECT